MINSPVLKNIFYLFIFSSLYIALVAVAMAFQTAYLFQLHHLALFYGFVFCGTVCSYNFHWAFTPKLFQIPISEKKGLDKIPLKLHFVLAIAALIGAGIFFIYLWQHWFWLGVSGFLSFLYSAPKTPLPFARHLRKFAYGKTIFLTLAWTYITAVLPLLLTDTVLDARHILFCVNRFYLIFIICILFDLRDRESDRKEGIRGMITERSLPEVSRIYWGSMIVYFFTAIALLYYFSFSVVLAFLIPGLILSIGFHWFQKQRSEFVYNFLLDGLMVFSLPLLLLFSI